MATQIIISGTGSPIATPAAWDTITIAGTQYGANTIVGGKVRVRGAARHYKIDIKDPKGSDGWSQTYRGLRPKKFHIDFFMWTDAQFEYFDTTVLPAIKYSGVKGNVQPLAVIHPALHMVDINNIFIENIGAPEQLQDGDSLFRSTVEVAEYLVPPPQNVTTTPIGAKTSNPNLGPGKPINPAIAQRLNAIALLQAQAQAGGSIPSGFQGPI